MCEIPGVGAARAATFSVFLMAEVGQKDENPQGGGDQKGAEMVHFFLEAIGFLIIAIFFKCFSL